MSLLTKVKTVATTKAKQAVQAVRPAPAPAAEPKPAPSDHAILALDIGTEFV